MIKVAYTFLGVFISAFFSLFLAQPTRRGAKGGALDKPNIFLLSTETARKNVCILSRWCAASQCLLRADFPFASGRIFRGSDFSFFSVAPFSGIFFSSRLYRWRANNHKWHNLIFILHVRLTFFLIRKSIFWYYLHTHRREKVFFCCGGGKTKHCGCYCCG